MSLDMSVSATYAGRPLEALTKLIEQRRRLINESAKDTVAAVAINVARSLRADTRVASERGKRLRLAQNPHLMSGWAAGKQGQRYRVARPDGGAGRPAHKALLTPAARANDNAAAMPVFDYWIDRGKERVRLLVAVNEEDALNHAPAVQRILKHAGLARKIWGVVMSEISGREPPGETAREGSRVEAIAKGETDILWQEAEEALEVRIHDKLNYARRALKSGENAVDLAMMRAANKTSGYLQQWAKTHWTLPWEEPVSGTPFPEIVRKRRRA